MKDFIYAVIFVVVVLLLVSMYQQEVRQRAFIQRTFGDIEYQSQGELAP